MRCSVCIVWTLIVQSIHCDIEPGEQVWKIKISSGGDISSLEAILVEPFVQLEREKRHQNYTEIYFRVEKRYINYLHTSLRSHGFTYEVVIKDVLQQLEIENDFDGIKRRKRSISSLDDFDYSRYHDLDEIERWMNLLVKRYDFVQKIRIGKSYLKKPLHVLKISSYPNNPNRQALYVDAATHAREWISPAALIYVCNQILSNSTYAAMLSAIDYYFVPVVNVDGYAYSWSGRSHRLWRKTRRPHTMNRFYISYNCVGVDGNRNWNVEFGGPGSSNNICDLRYRGPRPESENVIHHLANFLRSKKHNIKGVVSLHSFGQQILYPYNYNKTKVAPTETELKSVGNNMRSAIMTIHGKAYENGRGAEVLYLFSGSTSDWAYEKAGIPLSYTIELRDTGTFEFELPANEIIPTGQELMAGIQVIAEHIIENHLQNQTLSNGDPKA